MADTKLTVPAPKGIAPKAGSPEDQASKAAAALERRKRYDELRAKMGRSKIHVKCPAGITAYWAARNDDTEMARLDWMGFKIVREDMSKPGRRFDAAGLRADGTYILGDVILMEIDSDTYTLQKEVELDVFEEMRGGIKQEFVSKATAASAPAFELNEKNERVPLTPA